MADEVVEQFGRHGHRIAQRRRRLRDPAQLTKRRGEQAGDRRGIRIFHDDGLPGCRDAPLIIVLLKIGQADQLPDRAVAGFSRAQPQRQFQGGTSLRRTALANMNEPEIELRARRVGIDLPGHLRARPGTVHLFPQHKSLGQRRMGVGIIIVELHGTPGQGFR